MADIYALSLDGVDHRYVGATTRSASRRLASHRYQARREATGMPLHVWMRQVGLENVVAVLLDRVPDEEIHLAERRWISSLRSEGYLLLNESDGGPGRSGVHPAEDIAKLAEVRQGRKHSKKHEFADIQTQVVSGARGAHTRWHAGRGIVKPDCGFCREEAGSNERAHRSV